MEYKIVDRAEDPMDSKIEKLGVVVKFSMREIEADINAFNKLIKELTATVDYNAAKMANIETYHPFVTTMSEEDLFTAHMYQDAKAIVKVGKDKMAEVQKALDDYVVEKADINSQIPDLMTPAQPAEVAAAPAEEAAQVDAPADGSVAVSSPVEGAIPTSPEFMPGAGNGPEAAQ